MPWTLTDLTVTGSGLIRTAIFTDTCHNLKNLNGTMLVAKLNSQHLGIFVSGAMKVEYTSVNGYDDPHAEDNLTQAIRDTLRDLKRNGMLFDDRTNVLSIKLSKSPCTRCADTLAGFLGDTCAANNIKIRIKIMKLYEGDSATAAANSIGKLAAAGIVCIPWRIEDKFAEGEDEFELTRTETKGGRRHELSGQTMDADEIRKMKDRTGYLERVAPMSSLAEYKGVKTPPSRESIQSEIMSLEDRIGRCEANLAEEMNKKSGLRTKRRNTENDLKREVDRLGNRPPTPGTTVANRIKRLRDTTIPNLQARIDEAESTILAIKTQREFLEKRARELEDSL